MTVSGIYPVILYGIVAAVGDAVACAAVSLKSFLVVPIWVPFVPAALAWIAAGIRGIKAEGLIGVGAISLIGGPILAARMISLPMSVDDRMAVGFSTIRQALAISLVVMLPLSIMCILGGVMIRASIARGLSGLPRQDS